MRHNNQVRWLTDLCMTVLLLLLMSYSLLGEALHEWLGTAMLALLLLHHVLNRAWHKHLTRGRYSPFRLVQTLVVLLLVLAMLGSMASGIVLSRYVFDFLPRFGGQETARLLHLLCAFWGFVLMGLHLGLHWGAALHALRRWTGCRPSRRRTRALRILSVLTAACGLYAFFRNGFPDYLLLRTHFVFFDYEQPLCRFYLEYLAILALFVWIGFCWGKGLLRLGRPDGK